MFGAQVSKVERVLRRRVSRFVRPYVEGKIARSNSCTSERNVNVLSRWNVACMSHTKRVNVLTILSAAGGILTMAVAMNNEVKSESKDQEEIEEGAYNVNPIQYVSTLLRLYEQIDQNMSIFAARMLEDLEKSVEKEKKENGGKLKMSPEQRALKMSIAFESTLEKVQDAVFRNNYVTKKQVHDAMQRLVAGNLRGGGPDGKISVAEAQTIDDFVRKLGRLRWKVTGSRNLLIPGAKSAWVVPEDKPDITVTTVIRVMEELIPLLTEEMEKIVATLRKEKLTNAEFRNQISQQYIKASGKKTEEICTKFKLDLHAFQSALMYYHDNDLFEKALAKQVEEQQKRHGFNDIGL
ncbi:unnamed protein product [Peronospora belbahrii]|uniref:Uncharacterized protein n=1 Tax=Peronospora belbahrii TaxID=622444 RepID=A0AAU9L938_9STRA|nr:unnamed protein product [Peronospora belbahrii]